MPAVRHPALPTVYERDGLRLAAQAFTQTLENAAGAQAVNRSSVAALAFLVYDILLTFDQEVKLIWSKRLSWSKLLFFFVRYFPVLVQVSILFVGTELTPQFHFTPRDCFIWQVWQGVSALLVIGSVDIILVLRVYALYTERPWILLTLGIAFAAEIICMVTSLALALPGVTFDEICTVTNVPTSILIYGAASVIFQTFLFGLTAAQFVRGLRARGPRPSSVVTVIVRDGTWAFALIFLVMVLQASLYALPDDKHSYAGVFYGWLLTTFSFCGYRILLNLQTLSPSHSQPRSRRSRSLRFQRPPGRDGVQGATGSDAVTGTDMQFTSAISVGEDIGGGVDEEEREYELVDVHGRRRAGEGVG